MLESPSVSSRASELRLLQRLELRILRAVIEICERHDLTYYISGGTYLGAVRHGGFIPWDDDVDIAMPRPDYEKLLKLLPQELPSDYELRNFETDPTCYRLWAKVRDRRVKIELPENSRTIIVPCWIDIFPLDGAPKPGFKRELWKMNLRFHELAWTLSRVRESPPTRPGRSKVKQRLIEFGNAVRFDRLLDARKWTLRRNRAIQSQPYTESEYCVNTVGRYTLDSIFHKKDIYGDGADYEFEGHTMRGPANYDDYLTQIYGEYRMPPSVENRNWHQTRIVTQRKYSIGLVAGTFETAAERELINEAHELCDHLIAGVYSDALQPATGTSAADRLAEIAAHEFVDEAVIIPSEVPEDVLAQNPFQVAIISANDLNGTDPAELRQLLASRQIELEILNTEPSDPAT